MSVLIFLALLLTGLIMWIPKNLKKANIKKSFTIKWGASFKRVNYDLHNVLGFYVLLTAFIIAATGLVWGFQWFARSIYWTTSAGKKLPVFSRPSSDTTVTYTGATAAEDKIWFTVKKEIEIGGSSVLMQFPSRKSDSYALFLNPDEASTFKRTIRFFDRNTLQELKGGGVYGKPFDQSTVADKISRMNYDIHVGAILGLPGKILAFFASLICASLPITGFMVWLGKKKKLRNKRPTSKHQGLTNFPSTIS